MPDVEIAEQQAVEPAEPVIADPATTPDPDEGDSTPQAPPLADLINEGNLGEVLALPAVAEHLAEQGRRAEQSARNKLQAEQRRSLNPAVVMQTAATILGDAGIDPQNLTQSIETRFTNLYGSVQRAAAESIYEALPSVLFADLKIPDNVRADYLEAHQRGDFDGAMRTLAHGARDLEIAAYKAEIDKNSDAEVARRVKQELEAAGENSGPNLPNTTRGTRAGNTSLALTTAEITALPASTWKQLPDEVKQTIEANVVTADAERGAETLDRTRLERAMALAT